MRKTTTICDRCGSDGCKPKHTIAISGTPKDLCSACFDALDSWMARDNTTTPGGYGPGWVEVCTHHIPCAGPCNSGYYVERR